MDVPPDIPIFAFIKRELKNQIESGELSEGARVPSELELARMYGVSRNPTRQALRDLEMEGYVVRMPGKGSFVAPVAKRQKLFAFNGRRMIAIACPELECRYSQTVTRAFIECAMEAGFHTMAYFPRFSNEAEFEFLADMRNSGIEGLAIWLQHVSERTVGLLRKFRRASYPFVLIDRYVRGLETDFVVTDNEDMAFQLTRELIERGHTDIGFVTTELDNTSTEDRLAGHRRAIEDAGIPFTDELTGVFTVQGEPIPAVVNRIMAHRRRPTAYFCGNDGVAASLIDELAALGYGVPDDVEVATVDDNELAAAIDLPLVTASQTAREMGRESARILLERIENPEGPVRQRFLKAKLHAQDLARSVK